MRIGEFAKRTGVNVRLLRYYDQQGLLRPCRELNGYRTFTDEDVRLVARIRTLLSAGLTTMVIRRLLPSVCEIDGVLRPCSPELADELRRESARIDAQITDLVESRRILNLIIAAAPTASQVS
ncbi:MerR family transcriptional regulator [Streptomyces sp. NBC_01727]|uniref:MerR family transcriptional regulator n=1 Tax=Streptomyces sp. NBC_01727 TaxID=2975924 RepID=UPI002E15B6A1|nr:MerR family transcriptional regulator [Streptomyces sp. NBC_01727]